MNSDAWNKARHGKTIVGRKEGYYIDAFGRRRHSTGKMEGDSLEGKTFHGKNGNNYTISPSHPSYAIQMADKWLKESYIPRAYTNAVNKTNFSKYLIEK